VLQLASAAKAATLLILKTPTASVVNSLFMVCPFLVF
jgi:hypothetical protein